MFETVTGFAYLVAAILFIMALRGLSHPKSSRRGNMFGIAGMLIAVITTLADPLVVSYPLIVLAIVLGGAVGTGIALKIEMTALPQLVAAFHSLVGLAAVLVAAAALYRPEAYGIGTVGSIKAASLLEMSLGMAIGAVTFTGSVVAFTKLQGLVSGTPVIFPGQHPLNAVLGVVLLVLVVWFCSTESYTAFWLLTALALAIGLLLIIPIGGADMPVVISMLNSYSGWAACGIGFTLGNTLLIIVGALVGSSGAILSYIMCKAMNRSIFNVILGGFGTDASTSVGAITDKTVKSGSAEDAAFIMSNAASVIIVPGYGMAVAQAQHALREMPSGIDNTIATYGMPLVYERPFFIDEPAEPVEPRFAEVKLAEPVPLVVGITGKESLTANMVARVRKSWESYQTRYDGIFDQIAALTRAGVDALSAGHFQELGELMNLCQGYLNALQLSTPELEDLIHIARENGALGAKLTGGGGGGSMIAICPDCQDAVVEAMEAAGYKTFSVTVD